MVLSCVWLDVAAFLFCVALLLGMLVRLVESGKEPCRCETDCSCQR